MVSPLIGQGVAAATLLLPNFKAWFLHNLDTQEILEAQFEPEELTEEVGANWAQHTALNRGNAILQFLNGSNDTGSFKGTFYKQHAFDDTPLKKLQKLKSWARPNSSVRRPPVLLFHVGDGHVEMNAVITGITGIRYGRPDAFGGLREVEFNVQLLRFEPFSLDDTGETDTRYARAKDRDYYELLAQQEYGDPLIGDVIRKQHPDQAQLEDGDVVRLPSIEGVRGTRVEQTSIQLRTAFGRKDTPQRRLRLEFFDLRNVSQVSHILQPSTTPTG